MKYHAQLTREDGKIVGLAGNEYIDIDIKDGNRYIARLTVRDGKVYDQQDNDIATAHIEYHCADCGIDTACDNGGNCPNCGKYIRDDK